ncbi:uncharacterized protein C1orf105 homolog isoform X7 [Felis catus]|uniref:uncharacterized protein C1orf105 homolog isoform X7 n=1 Tax=Felis catus TaxID=9685 RepID=UPI001D199CEE|nr:uncharacterized protein C1orf105 homolog isoform X7 [Felis catus]
MEKRELKVSVPKFDKIPWLSEASRSNKPLVLSLPKSHRSKGRTLNIHTPSGLPALPRGSPGADAVVCVSGAVLTKERQKGNRGSETERPGKRKTNSKTETEARRDKSNPMLIRSKQLCSTCQEIKMVQPRTLIIPHNLKLSFENLMSHRMMSLPPPKAKTESKHSCNDISTESIHYRLPILGPRTAVFHGLLADTYRSLRETQLSSLPGKEPVGKTMRQ